MSDRATSQGDSVISMEEKWADAQYLPCRITVDITIPAMTVGRLLELAIDSVVDTGQEEGAHLPVLANGQVFGWGELGSIDERLTIHLVDLI